MDDRYSDHKSMSAAQLRKINKPVMEKKRRARINSCLEQLKTLVLEAMQKDPSRYSKLEKADILEMSVKYLRDVQRQHLTVAAASDPTVLTKYRSGFSECAKEVAHYLSSIDGVPTDVRGRMLDYLTNCLHRIPPSMHPAMMAGTAPLPMQPINVQIPGGTPMMSLPGSRLMTQSPPMHTLMTPDGGHLQGSFQVVPGPFPGDGGLTVFVPSSPGAGPLARYPHSPTSPLSSSLSDASPVSSPESNSTPRVRTLAERKHGNLQDRPTKRTGSEHRPSVSSSQAINLSNSANRPTDNVNVRLAPCDNAQPVRNDNAQPASNSRVVRDVNHNEVVVKLESMWRPW